jgi:predicted RecB family nuclease
MQEGKPIENLLFDFVSILHSKAQGVAAYAKYLQDAREENSQECIELLERLQEQDTRAVNEVKDHLAMLLARSGSRTEAQSAAEQPRH